MSSSESAKYDFFLSRRGSVAAIAREVADVLNEKGYKVLVQDYDTPLGASFIEAMHEAVKNSRDLVILFTRDYEQSPYTRKEFTSFEAERAQSAEERHIIVLRCEDAPLRGLLADNVYQDLVGIDDPEQRKQRIIAAAERQSQAVPPPPRPFIGVPPRIASFTGRTEELDKLDAILMHDKPAAVTQAVGRAAVQGMGGVGKTSLAVEYAHRYRKLYAGVCWCPAETRTGLLSALATLAVTLGVATADEFDVERAARAALRRLDQQRATWLLAYDNVASPDEITDLLPSSGARVLITSRFSDWGGMADEVALDVLSPDQAVAFLQTRAGRSDTPGGRRLAETLGYLPLALDHAGAYCKRTQMRFDDYAAKASDLMGSVPRSVGYPRSVAATFDLAISEAVSQCAVAEALMAFLAQCGPERTPFLLVEGSIDDEAGRLQALAVLVEVSLLKHDPFSDGTEAVTVHRLIQMIARARSEGAGSSQAARERVIARLAAIYPGDGHNNPKSWPLLAQLTPHLLALQAKGLSGNWMTAKWSDLLSRGGGYLHARGAYAQATLITRDALAVREKMLGPEHPSTAESLLNLAGLLQDQGDLTGARPLCERALAIQEKALGAEHPETAQSLNNLACLLEDQGDLAGARSLFERALAIREKVCGAEHYDTSQSLNNLAHLLQQQGDLAGARPLYERALAIREKVLGPEHPATATSLNNLANLLDDQGDLAGARRLYERAMAIQEQVLGSEHPNTAFTLANVGVLLRRQGDLAGARRLYERALTVQEKVLGAEHHDTARTLNHLARLLQEQGDLAGARPLFERALAIREKVFGAENPHTAVGLNNLARLLHDQGDLAGARPLYQRALAIREKLLGADHPDTALSLGNLASLLHDEGDLAGAQPLYERELAIDEKIRGPEHPDTATDLSNLARLLRDTGQAERAEPLFRRAISIGEKALGRGHANTNRYASHYARLLVDSGRAEEALTTAQSALANHEATSGLNHPWTKDSARVTADALHALGRADEAKALRERYGLGSVENPNISEPLEPKT